MVDENEKNDKPAESGTRNPDQMTEDELRAELEKHFREQPVPDLVVQFMVSLTNLAYMKMGLTEDTRDVKDLVQASIAIDSFKALLESVGKRLPSQDASALAGALSSMQLTFVKASAPESGGGPSAAGGTSESGPGSAGGSGGGEPEAEPEAKAETGAEDSSGHPEDDGPASRLWTPGKK